VLVPIGGVVVALLVLFVLIYLKKRVNKDDGMEKLIRAKVEEEKILGKINKSRRSDRVEEDSIERLERIIEQEQTTNNDERDL
jgi:hypothetical protein